MIDLLGGEGAAAALGGAIAATTRRSTMGEITGGVGPSSDPIPVSLEYGDLYDSTPDALDLGANAFALVKGFGQSEIGQFLTAVETGTQEYEISGLRRGVKGTDATTHTAGERFVMLAGAMFLPLDSSLYGRVLHFRAVTNGTDPENNQSVAFLFEAPPEGADHRITEAGDYRITEAGDRRILE